MILSASEIKHNSRSFGGKVYGLFKLSEIGLTVPTYYVIPFNTIEIIKENKEKAERFIKDWKTKHAIKPETQWAIRSSADIEDGELKSYAGQFLTYTNIPVSDLVSSITELIDKTFSLKIFKENDAKRLTLILQEMVMPDYSGVAFSKDPHKKSNSILINILPGLGEFLVSGTEKAFTISIKKKQNIFYDREEMYSGKIFLNGIKEISKSGAQIQQEIKPHLKLLKKKLLKLEKLYNQAVDVEFAISNNTIYWLQLRPITAFNYNSIPEVLDNANISENFPGLVLPLTSSFVRFTYQKSYKNLAEFLGMNKSNLLKNEYRFKQMVSEVNGVLYYNITAWQQLLYQYPLGKITSKQLTKLWHTEPADFETPKGYFRVFQYFRLFSNVLVSLLFFNRYRKKYYQSFDFNWRKYESLNISGFSYSELIYHYRSIQTDFGANWVAPLINGFFTMVFYSALRNAAQNTKLQLKYPNFVNDILFSQGDVISITILNKFNFLAQSIQESAQLNELFIKKSSSEIWKELKESHFKFYELVMDYIYRYGERCGEGELKMEVVDYKENPLKFIDYLKSNLEIRKDWKNNSLTDFDYKNVLKKTYPLNFIRRWWMLFIIRNTINRIRDRENNRFYRTRLFGLIRKVFREMDKRLLSLQLIDSENDSLYLKLDEIISETRQNEFKSIIEKRKKQYEDFKKKKIINRYHYINGKYVAFEPDLTQIASNKLKGTGCCSGIVSGKVKVLSENNDLSGDFQNCILVAKNFEPGWIHIFSQAKGLLSERGNLLSHTSILCREMGLPSIVGIKNLLSSINEGDTIQMNGSTGQVVIIDEKEPN